MTERSLPTNAEAARAFARMAPAANRAVCRIVGHRWGDRTTLAEVAPGSLQTGTRWGAIPVPPHEITVRACKRCGIGSMEVHRAD